MRLALILGAAVTAAFFAMPSQDATADYCVNDGETGRVCGHATMQQCEQTRAGLGGWCEQDQFSKANNAGGQPQTAAARRNRTAR
jgi:hypothetical protein